MNRVRVWLSALALVALAALPVSAQVQTGSILVRVTDAQGSAVPGVRSRSQARCSCPGTMAGVTDTGGVNRFPSLQPGIYSVKLELQGFRTVVRENVHGGQVGQTVPLDSAVAGGDGCRNGHGDRHLTGDRHDHANTSVNLGEQLLQHTPGGRDIWALVESKVPSLVMSRPDVGGTSGGLQGTFSARGTASAQNTSVPERRQRRRSGGDRRGRFLLRLRRVRRHPGLDRRARHHRADQRRVPQHDHQDRRQPLAAAARRSRGLVKRLQGRNEHRPELQRYGFRPEANTSTSSPTSTSSAAAR